MGQRKSEYERIPRDQYETPAWVTEALLPHIPDGVECVWEPACGSGKMSSVLRAHFRSVLGTDIAHRTARNRMDFLQSRSPAIKASSTFDAIITNPPYSDALKFCEHALALTKPFGFVAMLLRVDFDSGITRRHIFSECPAWHKKIVLIRRIKWFDDGSSNGPSENHAWYLWDHYHEGPATIAYAPK